MQYSSVSSGVSYHRKVHRKSAPTTFSPPTPTQEGPQSVGVMRRLVRTTVPKVDKQLLPTWSYNPMFREKDEQFKVKQKKNYDYHCRHQVYMSFPPSWTTNQYWFKQEKKSQVEELSPQQRPQGPTLSAPLQDRHAENDHTWRSNRLTSRAWIYQMKKKQLLKLEALLWPDSELELHSFFGEDFPKTRREM